MPPTAEEYRPGREATLYVPPDGEELPLVVMVPGGGWRTADPSGLAGLAATLAESGLAALTLEVGAAEDGVTYPTPVEDILCGVGYGLDLLGRGGYTPGPVILLGHSSGAHLASLAASTSMQDLPECDHPAAVADALVGLAGVYDVTRLPALAYLLFGALPEETPEAWLEGNPLLRAGDRPEVPVLLLHGQSDPLVPVSFTQDYAEALREAGHDTTVELVPGADHTDIYSASVSGDVIVDWIETMPSIGDG
ncbi:MAG: alpha/beta hydrolase family protein [Actinomycetota bacterium]